LANAIIIVVMLYTNFIIQTICLIYTTADFVPLKQHLLLLSAIGTQSAKNAFYR